MYIKSGLTNCNVLVNVYILQCIVSKRRRREMYVNLFHKKSTLSGYQNSNLNTLNVKLGKDMQEKTSSKIFFLLKTLFLKETKVVFMYKLEGVLTLNLIRNLNI